MRRRIVSLLAVVALVATAMVSYAVPTLAHDFDANCSGISSAVGLLYVFDTDSFGGDEENACNPSDSNWGCCSGTTSIQDFNDKMSSYHLTDKAGDGLKFCVRFYADAGFAGAQKLANNGDSLGSGGHRALTIPASWNDRVSSHEQYAVTGASC